MSQDRADVTLGPTAGAGMRFAVVVSRYNLAVTDRLRAGAVETLIRHGVAEADVLVEWVPGAFELPLAAGRLARANRLDGVVCLGALIRGETSHFDVLAHATAAAVQDTARETGVPISFGVITTENLEQAEARAGGAHGNKGEEAALATLELALLYRRHEPGS
jgi:6,7-dimethyl-8-ribityllumazine synthase